MKRFGLQPGRQKEATKSYRSSKFLPNTHGVSAMSEKMEDSFWLSTTEGANNVVGPTSRLEPICRPKSILDGEPSK